MAIPLPEAPVTGSSTLLLERPTSAFAAPRDTLVMLRVLDATLIEDSENEPPDFAVPNDDLGF